jgi:hypothetical protein
MCGYCTYTSNAAGQHVAQWIGNGTDAGKSWTLTFNKGSAGYNSKTSACDAVRKAFCNAPKTAAGRCPPGYNNTSSGCVKRAGATLPASFPQIIKPASTSVGTYSGSGGGGRQDPYCKEQCDAKVLPDNLWCRLRKAGANCGGSPGGPPWGNPFNFSGSALDPQVKSQICAKNCETLDVFCKGAKVQAGCGGNDYTFWIIAGVAGIVGVVILTRVLK